MDDMQVMKLINAINDIDCENKMVLKEIFAIFFEAMEELPGKARLRDFYKKSELMELARNNYIPGGVMLRF